MVKIAQLKILTIAIVGPGVSSDSWLNHRMVLVSAPGEQKQRVAAAKRDLSKSTPDCQMLTRLNFALPLHRFGL
jgi:hypothetical protein